MINDDDLKKAQEILDANKDVIKQVQDFAKANSDAIKQAQEFINANKEIFKQAQETLKQMATLPDLNLWKSTNLGKKGRITQQSRVGSADARRTPSGGPAVQC